jgi:NAD(P)-dependent dehydrogenase (short-subunit alcohol dehydrogenase family)
LSERLGAAALHCDVASEQSVAAMARMVEEQAGSLDMLINAAGGGYARTLGMYRVSRALMPVLRSGARQLLVNIPPSPSDAAEPAFPYASSRLAFHRLSSALAHEGRGSALSVWIACPAKGKLVPVLPDPNAGTWADSSDLYSPSEGQLEELAWQVASLLDSHQASHRHAS